MMRLGECHSPLQTKSQKIKTAKTAKPGSFPHFILIHFFFLEPAAHVRRRTRSGVRLFASVLRTSRLGGCPPGC